jgi:hypothetical protein
MVSKSFCGTLKFKQYFDEKNIATAFYFKPKQNASYSNKNESKVISNDRRGNISIIADDCKYKIS